MSWTFWLFLIIIVPILIITILLRISLKAKYIAAKTAVDSASNAPGGRNFELTQEAKKNLKEALASYGVSVLATRVLIAIGVILIAVSSIWFVPVRNVGIVTAFNAPTGRSTGNGLKITWP